MLSLLVYQSWEHMDLVGSYMNLDPLNRLETMRMYAKKHFWAAVHPKQRWAYYTKFESRGTVTSGV